MNARAPWIVLGLLAVCIPVASGQRARRDPHIGYAYPGGGPEQLGHLSSPDLRRWTRESDILPC